MILTRLIWYLIEILFIGFMFCWVNTLTLIGIVYLLKLLHIWSKWLPFELLSYYFSFPSSFVATFPWSLVNCAEITVFSKAKFTRAPLQIENNVLIGFEFDLLTHLTLWIITKVLIIPSIHRTDSSPDLWAWNFPLNYFIYSFPYLRGWSLFVMHYLIM